MDERQITWGDVNPEYQAFIDKFKPKKTTDDCYTPPIIFEAVLAWVEKEYNIDREKVVRPFWPGADYETAEYPAGCVVVDNPPFSLRNKIVTFYMAHEIPFFLFSPGLTLLTGHVDVCHIACECKITYDNGATVNTGFITNLDKRFVLRTAPDLNRAVKKANDENKKKNKAAMPKYTFPANVITAAGANRLANNGVVLNIERKDAVFVRSIDAMNARGKHAFGGCLLLSDRAAEERRKADKEAERRAAERAAALADGGAIVWKLSEREKGIIALLGKNI